MHKGPSAARLGLVSSGNMRMTSRVFATAVLLFVSLAWMPGLSIGQDKTSTSPATASAGWPKWRGSNGDCVVTDGTRIAAWTDKGPVKIWESPAIPGGQCNGYWGGSWGSPVVAGDRVYVYATCSVEGTDEEKVLLLSQAELRETLGWSPTKLPNELSKAVEEARSSAARAALKPEEVGGWVLKTRDALMAAWSEKATPTNEERKQFMNVVTDRLKRGPTALPFEVLDKLAGIKDRVFKSQAELDKWFDENQIDADVRKRVTDLSQVCLNLETGASVGHLWPPGREKNFTLPEDAVYCLNAADGKIVWKHVVGRGVYNGGYPGSATPCVADGRVFILRNDGRTSCLNAKDGAEIWTAKPKFDNIVPDKYGVMPYGGHGSVVVVDGLAVVQAGPWMAFDAATGAVAWTQRELSTIDNTPTPWVKDGKTYLICNSGPPAMKASCVDVKTGKIMWSVPGGYWCSPAVSGDYMAVYTGKKLLCYRMSLDKADLIWEVPCHAHGYNSACPVIYKNRVYQTEQSRTFCVNLEDGKMIWEGKTVSDEWGSAVWVDDKLVIATRDSLSVLNAASDKFEPLATVKMPGLVEYPISAIANGRMYLRFRDGIRCFDVSGATPTAAASAPAAK